MKLSDSSNLDLENHEEIKDIFEITDTKNYYIIMDGFGDSLREVHEDQDYKFSFKTSA